MVAYAYTCILSCFGLFIMPKRQGVSGVIDVHSEEYILGQNIKKYRALKNWTQGKLSEVVNIDRAEISKYESGQNGEMGFKMLKRFAKALEISVEQLLNEGDEPLDQTEQHIERYERLNAKNQEMIDQMMDALILQQSMAS